MSKNTKDKEMPEMIKPSPPSISIDFNKQLKAPKEFYEVSTGDRVRIIVAGKILKKEESESTDEKSSWENYQRLKIEISAVDIEPLKSKAKSLKDAMEEVIEKRRT